MNVGGRARTPTINRLANQLLEAGTLALRPGGIARAFIAGSGFALLAKLLNGAGVMLINAILARNLVPGDYGIYLLGYSAVIIGSLLTAAGLHNGAPRLLGEAWCAGAAARLFGSYRAIVTILGLATLLVTALVVVVGDRLLGVTAGGAWLGFWLAVWIVSMAWRSIGANSLRVLDRQFGAAVYDGPLAAILMLLVLLALAAFDRITLGGALFMGAVSSLASAVPCMLSLRRTLGERPPIIERVPIASVLVISLPMLVAAVLAQLSFQLPLWLLGWFGNSHEVALYGAGAQLFMALNLMFGVTAIGAMPSIIRLHARGERERLARFARGAALVSALPVAVSVAALVWFGPDLTSLIFGPDYRESGTVALLLCFGLLFQTLFGLNATLLVMTGSQLSSSLVLLGGTLSLLVLTWVLYFEAGVTGAALAAASVLALQNAALGMLVKRRLGFVPCAWIR